MNVSLKLAMGAAAVVLVALIGYNLLPGRSDSGVGGPEASPTASPTPTPIALSSPDVGTTLSAGRYRLAEPFLQPVSLTLPAGWQIDQLDTGMVKLRDLSGGAEIDFVIVDGVPLDPCHSERGDRSPAPVTASGLEAAFRGMTGFDATPPLTTSIDGQQVRRFTISNSIDTSTAGCSGGTQLPLFHVKGGDSPETNGGTSQELRIVDVGSGLLILTDPATTALSTDEKARMDSILSSIAFE